MRVLMTGFTPRHVGREVALGYGVIGDYMKMALELSGCQVDRRVVVPGEELTSGEYDALVIGLSPPKSNSAYHLYGALWAMMHVEQCSNRLMFYVDDWQYDKVHREVLSETKNLDSVFNAHKRTCRAHFDRGLELRSWIEVGLRTLADHEWPTTVYPSWSWGDTEIVARNVPSRTIIGFDPTAWALPEAEASAPALVSDTEREQRWVLSSLINQQSWLRKQAIEWPTLTYGPGGVGSVPEIEVRTAYARAWGVLSPEYGHAGSGWWRCRVVNTVTARAVLLGGRTELARMGSEWVRRGPEIEAMSTEELRSLADAQWVSVRTWATPMHAAAESLRDALERSKV